MWAGGTAETQEPEAQEGRERPRPRAPPRTPPAAGAGWVYGNRVATAVLCRSAHGCGRGAPGLGGCRPCGQGGPSPSPAESGLRPGPSSLSLPASCPFPSPPLRVAAPAAAPARPGRRQGGRPALPAHARRGVLGGAGAFFGPVGLGAPEPTMARGPLDSERYFGPGVGFPGGRERDARPAGARRAPRARGQPRRAAFSALMSSRASLGGFKAPSITTHPPNHLQEALGSRSLSRA